jgi:hypothetical protein
MHVRCKTNFISNICSVISISKSRYRDFSSVAMKEFFQIPMVLKILKFYCALCTLH